MTIRWIPASPPTTPDNDTPYETELCMTPDNDTPYETESCMTPKSDTTWDTTSSSTPTNTAAAKASLSKATTEAEAAQRRAEIYCNVNKMATLGPEELRKLFGPRYPVAQVSQGSHNWRAQKKDQIWHYGERTSQRPADFRLCHKDYRELTTDKTLGTFMTKNGEISGEYKMRKGDELHAKWTSKDEEYWGESSSWRTGASRGTYHGYCDARGLPSDSPTHVFTRGFEIEPWGCTMRSEMRLTPLRASH